MSHPTLHLDTPFAHGLQRLLQSLEERAELATPVEVFLAGGMAVHLYTGKRVTHDVDVEFGARILIPTDLVVDVDTDAERAQPLFLDANYNPMFSLLHPDYQEDAITVPLRLKALRLRVLAPVDLAVSKMARLADVDREDILDLVRLGLTTSSAIAERAAEALKGYVGNTRFVEANVRDAVAAARALGSAAGHRRPAGPRR